MAHVQFSVDETKDIDHASRPLLDDAERGFDDGDEADRAAYEADHDDWIRSDTQSVDSVVSLGDQGGEVEIGKYQLPYRPRKITSHQYENGGTVPPPPPRTDYRVRKSFKSRVGYACAILNIVIWWPLWLKLIQIKRIEPKSRVSVFDPTVHVELASQTLTGVGTPTSKDQCTICGNQKDITYPVQAHISNFTNAYQNTAGAYTVLLQSWDLKDWFVANRPGKLMVIPGGESDTELCSADLKGTKTFDDDDATPAPAPAADDGDDTPAADDDDDLTATDSRRLATDDDDTPAYQPTPKPNTNTDDASKVFSEISSTSTCCMGSVTAVYLVACLHPEYEDYLYPPLDDFDGADDFANVGNWYEPWHTKGQEKTFEDRCIAVDSLCGSPCGMKSGETPKHCKEHTVNNADGTTGTVWKLPQSMLINQAIVNVTEGKQEFVDDDDYKWQDTKREAGIESIYHFGFIGLMTISALSAMISFLPGVGNDYDPPCPSMSEVEEHMLHAFIQSKDDERLGPDPLCLVAFSISAGEPRMMVLRNLCGKMMAWVKERKFVFDMPASLGRDTLSQRNSGDSAAVKDAQAAAAAARGERPALEHAASSADDDFDTRRTSLNSEGRPTQYTATAEFDNVVDEKVEMVDIFQDEGHRVGCYAVWDAFVDVINEADLLFVENLANKMREMTADDKVFSSKKEDAKKAKEKKEKAAADAAANPPVVTATPAPSSMPPGDVGLEMSSLPSLPQSASNTSLASEDRPSVTYSLDPADVNDKPPAIDDPNVLLDDELRGQVEELSVDSLAVRRLELAWSCYDLLTLLGHPYYWRGNSDTGIGGVKSFYAYAGNDAAEKVLRRWVSNVNKNKGKDPFARGIAPVDDPAISKKVWRTWWKLYSEQGKIRWTKNFDFTQFRVCKVKYYAESSMENNSKASRKHKRRQSRASGSGAPRSVVMCYSARADPEAVRGISRPVRGIKRDTFVHLKETYDPLNKMSAEKARRCHARVLKTEKRGLPGFKKSYARLTDCSPEMLEVMERKANAYDGDEEMNRPTDLVEGGWNKVDHKEFHDEIEREKKNCCADLPHMLRAEPCEATVKCEELQALRPARGKSGGMNHAVDILDAYLVRRSNCVRKLRELKEDGITTKTGRLFFAIFDCRHMGTQGFWDAVVPHFFRYVSHSNPWLRTLDINTKVAFVQLPQTFAGLDLDEDFFDMRNEYGFRIANTVRSGVGGVTSCGTNAVWNYEIQMQKRSDMHDANDVREGRKWAFQTETGGEKKVTTYDWTEVPLDELSAIPIRFNEETMIEDTASSHDQIIAGRKGIYHFERLVIGARKGTSDYLAAVYRWSKGAVQLFWTSYWPFSHYYAWPWIVMVAYVLPIGVCTVYLQLTDMEGDRSLSWANSLCDIAKSFGQQEGEGVCSKGVMTIWVLILNPVYIGYFIYMVSLFSCAFVIRKVAAYVIMFENTTYFFNSLAAFFWLAVPIYICYTGKVPLQYDAAVLTLGGLWIEVHGWIILLYIKEWAPLEKGSKPKEQSLLRAQQMYFITAPLHCLALMSGMISGIGVVFFSQDASRWSSFDNAVPLIAAKLWVIFLVNALFVSICVGCVKLIILGITAKTTTLIIGVLSCMILLTLIAEPAIAMFFYKWIHDTKKNKDNCWNNCTSSIFSSKMILTTKHVFVVLWAILLVVAFKDMTGVLTVTDWNGWAPTHKNWEDDLTIAVPGTRYSPSAN